MSLWIPVTIAAAIFQTLRFMLQKHLSRVQLSAAGATFARFLYSAPLVAVLLAIYLAWTSQALPDLSAAFWIYGLVGGAAQVFATVCVVMLLKERNFAVGITFKKTEVMQTVFVGLIVLGEGVSWLGFAAIFVGLIGVMLLSDPPGGEGVWLRRIANRAAGLGLVSGVFFAISGVCYRGASLEIASADPLLRAGVTLSAVTMMQMLGMALWLSLREAGQISAVWRARSVAGWIGLTSMAGSALNPWFYSTTIASSLRYPCKLQPEVSTSVLTISRLTLLKA